MVSDVCAVINECQFSSGEILILHLITGLGTMSASKTGTSGGRRKWCIARRPHIVKLRANTLFNYIAAAAA
jgi:hypothetical protein